MRSEVRKGRTLAASTICQMWPNHLIGGRCGHRGKLGGNVRFRAPATSLSKAILRRIAAEASAILLKAQDDRSHPLIDYLHESEPANFARLLRAGNRLLKANGRGFTRSETGCDFHSIVVSLIEITVFAGL